jgi:hypothetical protein
MEEGLDRHFLTSLENRMHKPLDPDRESHGSHGARPGRRGVPHVRVGLAAALLVAVAPAGLSGCSRGTAAPAATSQAGSSSPARSTAALALLTKARGAALEAGTVRARGTVGAGGRSLSVDLTVGGAGAVGTVRSSGGTAQVRVIGPDLFLLGDAAFWNGLQPGVGPVFAGTWTEVSEQTAPEFGPVLRLVPVTSWFTKVAPSEVGWVEAPGKTVDGVVTKGLRAVDKGVIDTLYVAAGGPGYPVQLTEGPGLALTFGNWGVAVPAVTPPTGRVLDARRMPLRG